jgi:hypothetical protein
MSAGMMGAGMSAGMSAGLCRIDTRSPIVDILELN